MAKKSTITYRLANENDYENINVFYNRVNKTNRSIEEFYWLFNDCPFGKSVYVIAEDKDKIVGTNCVIPFNFVTNNKNSIKTGKSEDTLVDPDYRGQGIFYKIYDVLFEKCKEKNIDIIWGFTSAIKPFKRIGFEIPFHIKQSVAVGKIFYGYNLLTSESYQGNFKQKIKLFGFSIFSNLKLIFKRKVNFKNYRISRNNVTEDVDYLVESNIVSGKNYFAIDQSSAFQNWRIYKNPYYSSVKTFGFYDKITNKLKALVVVNVKSNVGYIIQSSFYKEMKKNEKSRIIKYISSTLFKENVFLLKNWVFDINDINLSELTAYNHAGHVVINKGMGFVWKNLGNLNYDPKDFLVSKISSQGTL